MKRIKIAPYGCVLNITTDFSEWNKAYKRLYGSEAPDGSYGLTYDNQDGHFLVGVFKGGLDTLVHELAHVCLDIAKRVQMYDIVQDQEQFCYLIGHMTGQVLSVLPEIKEQT